MDSKNNTTLIGITNFLEAGALLRHEGQWILIEGPFEPASDANSDDISVFFSDFYDLQSSGPFKGARVHRLSSQELQSYCEAFLGQEGSLGTPLAKAPWREPALDDFTEAFRQTQERLATGELRKAVPAVFSRSAQTVTAVERAQMILNLTRAPEALYVYGFWREGEGVLGATPEVLFEYRNKLLKTMALAGTCPKSEAHERDSLLRDEKEMQEHLIVLEDIKNSLEPLGSVTTEGPGVVELPTLYHLKTTIEVQCSEQPDFLALIKQLHPTPALGVAPRSLGYQWMRGFPGQEGRRGFGAPFAFLGRQEALCLVAIRNLQWNKTEAMIGSGCGVVAASELNREWRELFQKRLSVRKILGLEL